MTNPLEFKALTVLEIRSASVQVIENTKHNDRMFDDILKSVAIISHSDKSGVQTKELVSLLNGLLEQLSDTSVKTSAIKNFMGNWSALKWSEKTKKKPARFTFDSERVISDFESSDTYVAMLESTWHESKPAPKYNGTKLHNSVQSLIKKMDKALTDSKDASKDAIDENQLKQLKELFASWSVSA